MSSRRSGNCRRNGPRSVCKFRAGSINSTLRLFAEGFLVVIDIVLYFRTCDKTGIYTAPNLWLYGFFDLAGSGGDGRNRGGGLFFSKNSFWNGCGCLFRNVGFCVIYLGCLLTQLLGSISDDRASYLLRSHTLRLWLLSANHFFRWLTH